MSVTPNLRQLSFGLLRLVVLVALAVACANFLNGKNYADYFAKTLVKIHAEPNLGVDASELARLIAARDFVTLQQILDRNYNVYALVITDCRGEQESCPGQKILFATNPKLYGKQSFRPERLGEFPFFVLRAPASTSVLNLLTPKGSAQPPAGEVLGRVYSISTIPTFSEDYRRWLKDPFRDNDLWRRYLFTMAGALLAAIIVSVIIELFLKVRRMEQQAAARREAELMASADSYLRQLEENGALIKEREQHFYRQFEAYVDRIHELEERIQDVDRYRDIAATIIKELEEERDRLSAGFREELNRTEADKEGLQKELERYRTASSKEKNEASRALAQAINPPFANTFEKRVFSALAGSPAAARQEWLVVPHLDVAGGKGTSKVLDMAVITRNCVMVLEVKNYWGKVSAEGEAANSRWRSVDGAREPVTVRSSWGLNPYHQVREYAMSLMNLLQQRQPQWRLPVYGIVVFPDTADLSALEERIGRYYRITRNERLLAVLEQVDGEARREHSVVRRPSPIEVEQVLRGR